MAVAIIQHSPNITPSLFITFLKIKDPRRKGKMLETKGKRLEAGKKTRIPALSLRQFSVMNGLSY